MINYANAGGRLFATHYSYSWLYNIAPFSGTATWNVAQTAPERSADRHHRPELPQGAWPSRSGW